MEIPQGLITIKLDGASPEGTERCRQIIHEMFVQGVFLIRNGSVTMHFDHEGTLQEIKYDIIKWRRNKPALPLAKHYERVKIE